MNSWFQRVGPAKPSGLRFFVFPHAGGSSLSYSKWRFEIPENTELHILDLPGRGIFHREVLPNQFDKVIEKCAADLERSLDRPSILWGHSMGSVLAYQTCRELSLDALGRVQRLGVSAFLPPTRENQLRREKIGDLSDEFFLKKLETFGAVQMSKLQDPAVLQYLLKVVRGDIRLMESFDPKPTRRLALDTQVYGGTEDSSVSLKDLEGWRALADVSKPVILLPGGHFYIFQNSKAVLSRLFSFS